MKERMVLLNLAEDPVSSTRKSEHQQKSEHQSKQSMGYVESSEAQDY